MLVIVEGNGWHGADMARSRQEGEPAPLMMGQALEARVRLIVWCRSCGRQAEPDVSRLAELYGQGVAVIDWATRLRCSACGSKADFVISGARR
jgi:hypothetical protein